MCNFLKKLFGAKKCCCHQGDSCCQEGKDDHAKNEVVENEVKPENSERNVE